MTEYQDQGSLDEPTQEVQGTPEAPEVTQPQAPGESLEGAGEYEAPGVATPAEQQEEEVSAD